MCTHFKILGTIRVIYRVQFFSINLLQPPTPTHHFTYLINKYTIKYKFRVRCVFLFLIEAFENFALNIADIALRAQHSGI